jgi:hypothetical protein
MFLCITLAGDWNFFADLLERSARVQIHNTARHDSEELGGSLILGPLGLGRAYLFDAILNLGNAVHVRQLL